MAVTDQQVKDYLIANPGLSDYAIAQKMDEFKVTPAQMAQATGTKLDDIQGRYNTAKDIGGYFSANQGLDDTVYARKINDSKWTAADVSRVTGAALPDVTSRLGTATKFNTLTDSNAALTTGLANANTALTGLQAQTKGYQDQIGLLNTQYGTLNTSYLDLQKQLAALKAKSASTSTSASLTSGSGVVLTGATNTSGLGSTPGASSTGAVYGPDGTAYPGPAAAIAAGVYNYTMFPPTTNGQPNGLVTNAINTNDAAKLSGVTGNYYGGTNQNPDNPWVNLYPTKA
jgi:hypothetical protein